MCQSDLATWRNGLVTWVIPLTVLQICNWRRGHTAGHTSFWFPVKKAAFTWPSSEDHSSAAKIWCQQALQSLPTTGSTSAHLRTGEAPQWSVLLCVGTADIEWTYCSGNTMLVILKLWCFFIFFYFRYYWFYSFFRQLKWQEIIWYSLEMKDQVHCSNMPWKVQVSFLFVANA